MLDIVFIVIMMWVLSFVMKKHGTWTQLDGGSLVGWFLVNFVLLGVTKWLILGLWIGFTFPTKATESQSAVASIIAIGIWFVLLYWRVGGRLIRLLNAEKK